MAGVKSTAYETMQRVVHEEAAVFDGTSRELANKDDLWHGFTIGEYHHGNAHLAPKFHGS